MSASIVAVFIGVAGGSVVFWILRVALSLIDGSAEFDPEDADRIPGDW